MVGPVRVSFVIYGAKGVVKHRECLHDFVAHEGAGVIMIMIKRYGWYLKPAPLFPGTFHNCV